MMKIIIPTLLLLLCVQQSIQSPTPPNPPPTSYFIIVDAGSSHTSMYVYSYPQRAAASSIGPYTTLTLVKTFRVPGTNAYLSHYANDPTNVGVLLQPLIDEAESILATMRGEYDSVPFHMAATAGVRVVPEPQRSTLMSNVRTYLNAHSSFKNVASILSGEEEGLYDWVAVNYLATPSHVVPPVGEPNIGALDLGGGSTQITFQTNDTLANSFPLFLSTGDTFEVYSHSYLQYGADAVESRVNALSNAGACLNIGFTAENGTIVGNSTYDTCYALIHDKLFDFSSNLCYTVDECSFNGVYQPKIPDSQLFYAFSTFSNIIEDANLSAHVSLNGIESAAKSICAMNSTELAKNYTSPYARDLCRDLTYMKVLLADGYKLSMENTNIMFLPDGKIDGTSVDWSLGYAVYHVNEMSWHTPSCSEKNTALIVLGITLGVISFLFVVLLIMYLRRRNGGVYPTTDDYDRL